MGQVDVVYVSHDGSLLHECFSYITGMTVAQLLAQSTVFERYPDARECPVGIFSRIVSLETLLQPGDRVELYRPLLSDPKEKRRVRASVNAKRVI